ncbi:MAG: hypothetical protein H0T47_17855 [Planctomycetaceae bacterium]|nr:hypothetical protein [Planctomycetaceae bacterium]
MSESLRVLRSLDQRAADEYRKLVSAIADGSEFDAVDAMRILRENAQTVSGAERDAVSLLEKRRSRAVAEAPFRNLAQRLGVCYEPLT